MYVITDRRPYGYGRPKVRFAREAWMKVKDPLPLRKGREAQGYSQRDLAALCRCTQAAISALETGKMTSCSEDLAVTICHWIKRDLEEAFVAPRSADVASVTTAPGDTRPRLRRTPAAARSPQKTAA